MLAMYCRISGGLLRVARAGGSVELRCGGWDGGCKFEAAAGEVNGAAARNASKEKREKKK